MNAYLTRHDSVCVPKMAEHNLPHNLHMDKIPGISWVTKIASAGEFL